MRNTLLALVCIVLTSCSNLPANSAEPAPAPVQQPTTEPEQSLQQITANDLAESIKQATADGDTVALQCWNALNDNLTTINKPLPNVVGVFSAIQAKRSIKARVDAGLPPAVVSGCSTLYVQEHFGVMQDIMKFLGVLKPGAGAIRAILP